MKFIFLILLCVVMYPVRATSLVEGVIYLKNGRTVEFKGHDRLDIPRKHRDIKGMRDAFAKTKQKEVYPIEEVDSVICWHARTPEYRRKFLPTSSVGWMWIYFETPYIAAYIYSKKGYGVATNGGINIYQRRGIFSRSNVKYYLRKQGENEYYFLGKTKSRTGKTFREKLCYYVSDDAELCESIRRSDTWQGKTVLLLREYRPRN